MWYRSGTVAVTNGSNAIVGTGTSWVAGAAVGEGFLGPDGRVYEITDIASNTSITLGSVYLGSTASGQTYQICPTQSYIRDLAAGAAELIADYGTVMENAGTGQFGDGTISAPGVRFTSDTDTGFRRTASGTIAVTLNGADKVTFSPTGTSGITKTDVGLANVDNTTDANKPVSTATQTALDLKANAANAALTGNVTVTTNSASPALTITQDGSGNALEVRDATGDTSPFVVDANGDARFGGSIVMTGAVASLNIGSNGVSTGACVLEIGNGRTGSGFAYIDLVSDTTYTDFGFRILRGADGSGVMTHRGVGDLAIVCQDAANFTIQTNGATRLVSSPTGLLTATNSVGLGYGAGSGGTVTQVTSRTTGVTVNKPSGEITLVSAAGSATYQSFTVTNSAVAATDSVIASQKSGTDLYEIHVTNVAAGSFKVTLRTTGGTTTEQPVIRFDVFKGATA